MRPTLEASPVNLLIGFAIIAHTGIMDIRCATEEAAICGFRAYAGSDDSAQLGLLAGPSADFGMEIKPKRLVWERHGSRCTCGAKRKDSLW